MALVLHLGDDAARPVVAVRATVHKPTAETKLGVTMSEGAKQGPPPPAGLIFRNEQSNELLPKLTGLGALEEPDADVKARMAKLNVEAAELRIVIARAHRAKAPRDRALADEIRKLELELGVAYQVHQRVCGGERRAGKRRSAKDATNRRGGGGREELTGVPFVSFLSSTT